MAEYYFVFIFFLLAFLLYGFETGYIFWEEKKRWFSFPVLNLFSEQRELFEASLRVSKYILLFICLYFLKVYPFWITLLFLLAYLFIIEFLAPQIVRIYYKPFFYLAFPFVFLNYILISPFVHLLIFLWRSLGLSIGKSQSTLQIFYESMELGHIDAPEMEMAHNVMEMKYSRARDCMVPRNEIESVDSKMSIIGLRNKFVESGFSKILVYQGNPDMIVGYVHAYDLFGQPNKIEEVLRPVYSVPESVPANTLLKEMMDKQKSIAVIFDEFGGLSGMLTLEDLMEEIFGEIDDEFDTDHHNEEKKIGEDAYIFSARLEIEYLNKTYGLELPESQEYDTLNGLLSFYHQKIPKKKEIIRLEPYVFTVLKAVETRVERIKLERIG